MGERLGVLLAVLLFLGGCVTAPSGSVQDFQPELYARHTKSGPMLQLHWNLSRTEQGVAAEGYAENVGDDLTRLKFIRLQLVGYDEQGREVVRSKPVPPFPDTLLTPDNPSFPLEYQIYGSFRISLPEPKEAVRFEVFGDYLFDTYPQGEGDDTPRRSSRRHHLLPRPFHPVSYST